MSTVHLQPPPIPAGGVAKWSSSGRSLSFALSPSSSELSVFVTPKAYSTAHEVDEDGAYVSSGKKQKEVLPGKVAGVFEQDRAVYFGKSANIAGGLNQLYADSHLIFKTAQELHMLSVATTSTIFPPSASQSTFSFSSVSGTPQPQRRGDPFINSSTNIQSKFMGSVVSAPKLKGAKGKTKGYKGLTGLKPGQEATRKYRQICDEYAWRLMVVARNAELDLPTRSKHASIHQILQLAATLYIPADGTGLGLIGEEMLYYYNEFADPEGTRELREMTEKAVRRQRSWEDEDFLEAIMRSILRALPVMAIALLNELKSHPQPSIWAFAQLLIHALETLPRSNTPSSPGSNRPKYINEAVFFQAHQEWKSTFRADVAVACGGKEKSGGWLDFEEDVDVMDGQDQGDAGSWENFFVQVVDVLLGKEEKVMEWADGWKGALGIWGVLVDVTVKRDDLPSIMETIWESSPADLTSAQEKIETALLQAEVTKALIHCNDFDLWLAAHLTDILDKMLIVEDDPNTFPISLRDYFILSYTDTLQAVPQYWNISVSYLATCGPEGFGRIRELVVRVGIDGVRVEAVVAAEKQASTGDVDMNGEAQVDDHVNGNAERKGKGKERVGTTHEQLNAVLEVCSEHNLDAELREICRSAAAILLKQRRYGEALSYSIRGVERDDFSQLATITDAVLDVYMDKGANDFIAAVESISPALMRASRDEQLNGQADEHLYPSTTFDYQAPNSGTSSQFPDFGNRTNLYRGHEDPYAQAILDQLDETSKKRLRFLGRYREFLEALGEGDSFGSNGDAGMADEDIEEAADAMEGRRSGKQRAADQVIYMTSRSLVPRRFWAVLLFDCIPLLEDEETLFSTTDTYELMRLMEEVTMGARTAPEDYLTVIHRLATWRAGEQQQADSTTKSATTNHPSGASAQTPKADNKGLRFLKSRAEREKMRVSQKQEMLKTLKSLDAFKLAALRNLSRTMLSVNPSQMAGMRR